MNTVFAKRLLNARKIRCMSQRDLSAITAGQVSPTAIAKYEKGLMMPSSSVLILLSKALNFKPDYFFRPFTIPINHDAFEFRKSATIGAKKVEAIKHLVCAQIENYIEIESLLNLSTTFSFDYNNVIVESESDARNLANQLRTDLNVGLDAIVSAVDLLENAGVKILEIDFDDKFSGTCNVAGGVPVIVINQNMLPERKRLTIFHELGHILMRFADGADIEKLCNVFAIEVLIPSCKLKELIGEQRHDISLVELQAIQREYGVSVDDLMEKAHQLNIISYKRYTTFYKKKNAIPQFNVSVAQSIFLEREHTNRYERLVYRALASEIISFSKAAALLNTSVDTVRDNLNLM